MNSQSSRQVRTIFPGSPMLPGSPASPLLPFTPGVPCRRDQVYCAYALHKKSHEYHVTNHMNTLSIDMSITCTCISHISHLTITRYMTTSNCMHEKTINMSHECHVITTWLSCDHHNDYIHMQLTSFPGGPISPAIPSSPLSPLGPCSPCVGHTYNKAEGSGQIK